MAAVRAWLVRPCFDEAAQELALADKLAERGKNLTEAEIRRLLGEEIEAIRAEAITKTTALVCQDEGCLYSLYIDREASDQGVSPATSGWPASRR